MTNPVTATELGPGALGRWAIEQTGSDIEIARQAGVTVNRLKDCRRLARTLSPELIWLVDSNLLSVAHGLALCRLEDPPERTTLAAALIHEAQVGETPVDAKRADRIVSERIAHPEQSIEQAMQRVAGLIFHDRPQFLHLPADLPELYEAAWRWRDRTIGDYITLAPERLARLTKAMQHIHTTGTAISGDHALSVTVNVSVSPD